MTASVCPFCQDRGQPIPENARLCGACQVDGVGRCEACEQWTDQDEGQRLTLHGVPRLCAACVQAEAKKIDRVSSAYACHDFLTVLTAFLADHGVSAEVIAYAVEKPWKWHDEYAIAVIANRLACERDAAERAKAREQVAAARG